jgi:hypothetical protein
LVESKENDLLAFHAIGLCRLRVADKGARLATLAWPAGSSVGAKISKTRSRRLVELENLYGFNRLPSQPGQWLSASCVIATRLRRRAGIKEWPKFHAAFFVSYRLAATGNAAQTALESGHDQTVLFAHYRELVKPKDAERFFAIMPAAETEKIVAIA